MAQNGPGSPRRIPRPVVTPQQGTRIPAQPMPTRTVQPGQVVIGPDAQAVRASFWTRLRSGFEWLENQKWFTAILIVVYFVEWLIIDLKASAVIGALVTPLSYVPPADDYKDAWYKHPLPPSMPIHQWMDMSVWDRFHAFLGVTLFVAVAILILWWLFQVNLRNKGRLGIAVIALFWVIGHWFDWVLGFFAWGGDQFSRGIPGLMQLASIGIAVLILSIIFRLMARGRRRATAPARARAN